MPYSSYRGVAHDYEVDGVVFDEEHVERVDPREFTPEAWAVFRRPLTPDENGDRLAVHVGDFNDKFFALDFARLRARHEREFSYAQENQHG